MRLSRTQANTVKAAIEQWRRSGILDPETSGDLERSIEVLPFDWKRLAKYSFWVSLICILTAVGAVVADKVLLAFLETIFRAPYIVKCFGLSIVSALIYRYGFRRRTAHPEKVYSNEAVLFLGVLSTAGAIWELGQAFDTGSGHFSLLLLFSFIVYGILGFCFRSNLVWLFAWISLGSWMGTETGYASGWGAYYLGMNYPLRFVVFGGLLTATALLLEKKDGFAFFARSTLAIGLLYLFIALWILSIFGNYGDVTMWRDTKQFELFHWAVLFAALSMGAIYHGLRFDNGMTKGFGITFLFIGLYTRYFEYFWFPMHKAIFFALLGASFWLLGNKAEKIWHLGER